MALPAGRVGVKADQVDWQGNIKGSGGSDLEPRVVALEDSVEALEDSVDILMSAGIDKKYKIGNLTSGYSQQLLDNFDFIEKGDYIVICNLSGEGNGYVELYNDYQHIMWILQIPGGGKTGIDVIFAVHVEDTLSVPLYYKSNIAISISMRETIIKL